MLLALAVVVVQPPLYAKQRRLACALGMLQSHLMPGAL